MNILDRIVEHKRIEVELRRNAVPLETLVGSASYNRTPIPISSRLNEKGATGIIAEFKRKSPSKGVINDQSNPEDVTVGYERNGASAVSILTDEQFFGGADQDVIACRPHLNIPILRKEFIIDAYQIHESKAMGADLILLIAACLSPKEVKQFARIAVSLGMEVLLELHEEEELEHVCDEIQLVGINNRSLKTFDVNIERSLRMSEQLPHNKIKVAESGIDSPTQVRLFRENGYKGFLIGENFMKTNDPALSLKSFIEKI